LKFEKVVVVAKANVIIEDKKKIELRATLRKAKKNRIAQKKYVSYSYAKTHTRIANS